MRHRTVGFSDLSASVVGLGAINFGNPTRIPDSADSVGVIHAALDAGITFIDTAEAYGDGEGPPRPRPVPAEVWINQPLKEVAQA